MKSLFLLLAAMTCTPAGQPVTQDPTAVESVGGAPETSSSCSSACGHLSAMGCEAAKPTPGPDGVVGTSDDGTCTAVCLNVQRSGKVLYPFACVKKASSCEAVDNCFSK